MGSPDGTKRIAIACQGGGSHTAFVAGFLRKILEEYSGQEFAEKYRIVALSGTSGGAICALLAWYGLLGKGKDGAAGAADLLTSFWRDTSARTFYDKVFNSWLVSVRRLSSVFVLPAVSPYDTYLSSQGQDMFERMLHRYVQFEKIEGPRDKALPEATSPMLLLGAVDVVSGEFRAFDSRKERITAKMALASTAIPTLFRAVHIDGGVYWDGLFSQNPPVRELADAELDEIWVVQVDPLRQEAEPNKLSQKG